MNKHVKIFSKSNRPKVLIIGNGLVRNEKNKSWSELIESLADEGHKNMKLPKTTPYSIQATVVTDDEDVIRYNKYEREFSQENYVYENNYYLDELLRIPFDAIITTNYTYEIEHQIKSNYPELKDESKSKYSHNTYNDNKKYDAKYLIRTFNRMQSKEYGEKDIWHIHGEQRRKTSMILTHNEYIKLINKEVSYLSDRRNEYEENQEEIYFKSWIDYFLLGELYIIGLGYDFSEFDLWWLLNRRIRENINKSHMPKVHFFEPLYRQEEDKKAEVSDVCNVLKEMKVNIYDLNVIIDNYLSKSGDKDKALLNTQYKEFYKKATSKIVEMMERK